MKLKPVWIIDLTDQKEVEQQLNDYLSSYGDGKKWFYYSRYSEKDNKGIEIGLGLDAQFDNLESIKKKYIEIVDNVGGLLLKPTPDKPALLDTDIFNINTNQKGVSGLPSIDSLDVYVIGDLKNSYTRNHFNTLIHKLKSLNFDTTTSWIGSEISCYYYGLLWMPKNLDVKGFLTDDDKQFLNQIHNFQQVGDNLYDNIFLFQSDIDEESKKESFDSMGLGILTISATAYSNDIGKYTQQDKNQLFYNAKASGIFYETEVHKEQQGFILSDVLLNSFRNENSSPFVDLNNIDSHISKCPLIQHGLLQPDQINASLAKNNTIIEDTEIEQNIFNANQPSVSDFFNPAKLWNQYYNDFLVNLKKNIINSVKQTLHWRLMKYQQLVELNTTEWIKENCAELENNVFSIFNENDPSANCSLQQLLGIAKGLDGKIKSESQKFSADNKTIHSPSDANSRFAAFPLSVKYQNALTTAKAIYGTDQNDNIDEKKALESLETHISKHPVIYLAQLIRAVLIALCLVFISIPFFKFLCSGENPILNFPILGEYPVVGGLIAACITLFVFVWKSKLYTKDLKSYTEQYIAVLWHKTNNDAYQFNQSKVSECYDQIINFSENWLIKEKIEKKLIGGLFAKLPRGFSFQSSKWFQPLLSNPTEVQENKVDNAAVLHLEPGIFDSVPLIPDNKIPSPNVTTPTGERLISELSLDDKMGLIRKLMKEEIKVNKVISDQLGIIEPPFVSLLLLDVSGSMKGDAFRKLVEIVGRLKDTYKDKIRWIAFSTDAKTDEECNDEIPKDFGFTFLDKALEKLRQIDFSYDKVILVSDGAPTGENGRSLKGNALLEMTNKAKSIGKPIDVIFIGEKDSNGEKYMLTLAEETNGIPLSASIDALEEKMKKNLSVKYQLTDADKMLTFDKLLKMAHVEACSEALFEFCKKQLAQMNYSIEKMLESYMEEDGLNPVFRMTSRFDNIKDTKSTVQILFKSTGANDLNVNDQLNRMYNKSKENCGLNGNSLSYENQLNSIVTCVGLQSLPSGLKALNLTYIPENVDATNDLVFQYYREVNEDKVPLNLFDKELVFKP
jgi:hypothetical protein